MATPYEKLVLLRERFNYVSGRITRVKNTVLSYDFVDPNLIKNNYELCLTLRRDLDVIIQDIMDNNHHVSPDKQLDAVEAIANCDSTIEELNVLYCRALSMASNRNDSTPSTPDSPHVLHRTPAQTGIRLPPIQIPTFSGDIKQYSRFITLFKAVYGTNPLINNAEKLFYLQSALTGEALDLVSNFPPNDEGYNAALEALKNRYHSTRTLAAAYTSEIFNFTPAKKNTVDSLSNFLKVHHDHISALKSLTEIHDLSDFLIFSLACRNLDPYTRRLFENHRSMTNDDTIPTYDSLIQFVTKQLHAQQLLFAEKPCEETTTKYKSYVHPAKSLKVNDQILPENDLEPHENQTNENFVNHATSIYICIYCNTEGHRINRCPKFLELSIDQRSKWIASKNRCVACLSSSHTINECKSKFKCYHCGDAKHNSILCQNSNKSSYKRPEKQSTDRIMACAQKHPSIQNFHRTFGTIKVYAKNRYNNYQTLTCILDTGSTKDLISLAAVKKLGLQVNEEKCVLTGVGDKNSNTLGTVDLTIESRYNDNYKIELKPSVLDVITKPLPKINLHPKYEEFISKFALADPDFNKSREVDLLLNVATTLDIMLENNHSQNSDHHANPQFRNPVASHFGEIIFGDVPVASTSSSKNTNSSLTTLAPNEFKANQIETVLTISDENSTKIIDRIQDLFEREAVPESPNEEKIVDKEDIFIENHFSTTFSRSLNGQFIVRLPFKSNPPTLGSNRQKAIAYFLSMENRLKRNEDDYKCYQLALQKFFDSNLIAPSIKNNDYILNQHIVIKRSSGKAKIVFNPAVKSPIYSLNSTLLCGPKLQRNLNYVLLSSRAHPICLACDIKDFYISIQLHPEDAEKLHIFARLDGNNQISKSGNLTECSIKHLPYGLVCSPFLALRCLKQLILEFSQIYPEACKILLNCRYIDDIIYSSENIDECIKIRNELSIILLSAQFELRKFVSSHPEAIQDIQSQDPTFVIHLNESPTVPVLGTMWNPISDTFTFEISKFTGPVTRRSCTSYLARCYDSLGLLNPVVFYMKKFVQNLWHDHSDLGWDTLIPEPLSDQWTTFTEQMLLLLNIKIPRYIGISSSTQYLVIFADASQAGWSCCAYVVSQTPNFPTQAHLIMAKSKLSPKKTARTIPQLEIAAIQLAAKLAKWILEGDLPYDFHGIYIYSDSMIALSYLNIPVSKLKVYVANRVSTIHQLTKNMNIHYNYIKSNLNPADFASRGLLPSQLINNELWFFGPKTVWTEFPPASDKSPDLSQIPDNIPDLKPITLLLPNNETNTFVTLSEKYSDFISLQRIVAYVLRFITNLNLPKSDRITSPLSASELNKSTMVILKCQQNHDFPDLYNQIKFGKPYPKEFLPLSPFLHDDILRVGGRLEAANINFDAKHPIILPKRCNLSTILCRHYHIISGHSGSNLSLSLMRQKFWVMSGKSLMRTIIHSCLTCAKWHPKKFTPIQGSLPLSRLTPTFPFRDTISIDCFGPYLVKLSSRRNSGTTKLWGIIFVCESTRAVHIECLSSLSAKDFLASFDRFTARRGLPRIIRSDNGGNFVSGSRQINECAKWLSENPDVLSHLSTRSIEFKHMPPYAPWLASHEQMIKPAKRIINSLLKDPLYFEEYNSLFARVEGLLNSRPYLEPSPDPRDLNDLLCPASFLTGGALFTPPNPIYVDASATSFQNRWDRLSSILATFWKKWSKEILHTLMQKQKWPKGSDANIKIGQLVWVPDVETNPSCWPLGLIAKVYPDTHGTVRVVDVKTVSKTMRRAVRNLVIVPMGPD